jgi:transposase
MNATTKLTVGIDTAKDVFQLYAVDMATGEVQSKQLKRAKFLAFFTNRSACLIGMEACGASHHWARQLMALGHEVKLISGKRVRAYVAGNKNDVADARAVWLALQQPGLRTVAVKTEAQQSVLSMHRMRQQLVKFRTMQSNCLRGLLAEYGEVARSGRAGLSEAIQPALARLAERLPGLLIQTLREQWQRLAELDEQIAHIEFRLQAWLKENQSCQRLAQIPGVGLLTATAAVATMGDPAAFRSGREFAAWLGLVPAQTGTGGRTTLLGISKRGDTYLRTLLIHGARSSLRRKEQSAWVQQLAARRPKNVVIVALANKMARTIWAMLAYSRCYDPSHGTSTNTM